jgi:hypothetical protein
MSNKLIPTRVNSSVSTAVQANTNSATSAEVRIAQVLKQMANKPLPKSSADCQREPWISIFFDGTGNNFDADIKTRKHSNVARLFEVHPKDDPVRGIYRIYIPGLGTYNRDISDSGDGLGGLKGNAVGDHLATSRNPRNTCADIHPNLLHYKQPRHLKPGKLRAHAQIFRRIEPEF